MPVIPAVSGGVTPLGGEWSVGSVGSVAGPEQGAPSSNFSGLLSRSLESLQGTQDAAAQASQALADGTATDPSAVVMAVERARLAMQLAAQLRTKGVEALNDIMHTQV
jgi:flagellar hook-basal body complex protein FliE